MQAPIDLLDLREKQAKMAAYLVEKGMDKAAANLAAYITLMDMVPFKDRLHGERNKNPFIFEPPCADTFPMHVDETASYAPKVSCVSG